MDRGGSSPRIPHEHLPRREDTSSPPWERSATMQVPFTNANTATPLSAAERHALPALWSARSNSLSSGPEPRRQHSQLQRSLSISECSPTEPPSEPWKTSQNVPYETQVFLPPTINTAASAPPFVMSPTRLPGRPAPPLTPPDSARSKSLDSTDVGPVVNAFPGTMSTRPGTTNPKSHRGKCCCEHSEADCRPETDKLGKRLKSAFHGMFKRKPVDDSEFIKIGEKHWADDDE